MIPVLIAALAPALAQVRLEPKQLPFVLRNGETARKHLPATMAGGLAILDFDNDGDLDLFFANGAALPGLVKSGPEFHNRLYANDGRGGFTDVTERAGVAGEGFMIAASAADYNNDGCVDLFVSGVHRVTLYRNTCRGGFTDATASAGLSATSARWANGAVFFDFDRDGDQDLFVVNYVRWQPETERECLVQSKPDFCHPRFYQPAANQLYRNLGDGRFEDVSAAAGIARHPGKGMAAAVVDAGDGLPSIFVANDRVFNFLFRNLGGGRFAESGFDLGVAVPQSGEPPSAMGALAAHLSGQARPDLVYTALRGETFPFLRPTAAGFEESPAIAAITRGMAGWGAVAADFGNRGVPSLFFARSDALSPGGGRGEAARERNALLENRTRERATLLFADISEASGLHSQGPAMNRGAAVGDLNGDGLMDVVTTALNAPAVVWWNRTPDAGHWIAFRVPAGTRVELTAAGRRQVASAQSMTGYASASAGPLHFGLGADTEARRVTVEWPNGRRREYSALAGGRVHSPEEARP
ncbi:MAG: CRTAC1 family protein [Acidobacteria bacterium]|nr:CRTAC1 family protein [Acidobacteriota bacterium]